MFFSASFSCESSVNHRKISRTTHTSITIGLKNFNKNNEAKNGIDIENAHKTVGIKTNIYARAKPLINCIDNDRSTIQRFYCFCWVLFFSSSLLNDNNELLEIYLYYIQTNTLVCYFVSALFPIPT